MELVKVVYVLENGVNVSIGDKVEIHTDGTEFPEYTTGEVVFINEDGVETEEDEFIRWDYVVNINLIEEE